MDSGDSHSQQPLWPRTESESEFDIVGLGENSLDRVCVVEGLPEFGGKSTAKSGQSMPGGQVASTLLGCARLGLQCSYLGSVGDDWAAEPTMSEPRSISSNSRSNFPLS